MTSHTKANRIPKETVILVNRSSLCLNGSWNLARTYRIPTGIISFSLSEGGYNSKRTHYIFCWPCKCLNETRAKKMELFLFTTSILQRFKLGLADSASVPSIKGRLGIYLWSRAVRIMFYKEMTVLCWKWFLHLFNHPDLTSEYFYRI